MPIENLAHEEKESARRVKPAELFAPSDIPLACTALGVIFASVVFGIGGVIEDAPWVIGLAFMLGGLMSGVVYMLMQK